MVNGKVARECCELSSASFPRDFDPEDELDRLAVLEIGGVELDRHHNPARRIA
jgi:hypothetical protein